MAKQKKDGRGKIPNDIRAATLREQMTKADQARAEQLAKDSQQIAELAYLLIQLDRRPVDMLGLTKPQYRAYQSAMKVSKAFAEKFRLELIQENEGKE